MQKILSLIFVLFFISACASLSSETTYPVKINSYPNKTQLTITNSTGVLTYSGVTPSVVKLKASSGFLSKESYTAKFSKEGFSDIILPINSSLNVWCFGTIIVGIFTLGLLNISPITGDMFKISTKELNPSLHFKVKNKKSKYITFRKEKE